MFTLMPNGGYIISKGQNHSTILKHFIWSLLVNNFVFFFLVFVYSHSPQAIFCCPRKRRHKLYCRNIIRNVVLFFQTKYSNNQQLVCCLRTKNHHVIESNRISNWLNWNLQLKKYLENLCRKKKQRKLPVGGNIIM